MHSELRKWRREVARKPLTCAGPWKAVEGPYWVSGHVALMQSWHLHWEQLVCRGIDRMHAAHEADQYIDPCLSIRISFVIVCRVIIHHKIPLAV